YSNDLIAAVLNPAKSFGSALPSGDSTRPTWVSSCDSASANGRVDNSIHELSSVSRLTRLGTRTNSLRASRPSVHGRHSCAAARCNAGLAVMSETALAVQQCGLAVTAAPTAVDDAGALCAASPVDHA